MASAPQRPLSPHLQVWKWGPHMMVSITHRITGFVLASAGLILLVWWLLAIAGGPESYAVFSTWVIDAGDAGRVALVANWLFRIVGVVLLWAFFQHLASGVRHFVLDTGAGYELNTNKSWSVATYVISALLTIATLLVVTWRVLGV